jgi:hypothetical protein
MCYCIRGQQTQKMSSLSSLIGKTANYQFLLDSIVQSFSNFSSMESSRLSFTRIPDTKYLVKTREVLSEGPPLFRISLVSSDCTEELGLP